MDIRFGRANFEPERADFRPERGRTNEQTNEQKKVPCVLQDFAPFEVAAQKLSLTAFFVNILDSESLN